MLDSILGHRPFGDLEPEEAKLRLDARCTLQGILARHSADQVSNLKVDLRTSDWGFRLPAPIKAEPFPMPFEDGFEPNNDQRLSPIFPTLRQHQPEESVAATKLRSLNRAL